MYVFLLKVLYDSFLIATNEFQFVEQYAIILTGVMYRYLVIGLGLMQDNK